MIIAYDSLVEEKLKHDKIDYAREDRELKKAFRHVEFAHTKIIIVSFKNNKGYSSM